MKIIIIGAGIMGRLLAVALSQLRYQLTLIDQELPASSSYVAAGMLAPITELEKGDPLIYQLGMESLNVHWPLILQYLPDTLFFRRQGSIVISHPHDRAELNVFINRIKTKIIDHHFKYQKINQLELAKLEPDLTKFHEGYYFPDEGQIDSQQLLRELEKYLSETIVWQRNVTVTHLEHYHNAADVVIDCRGLGAKSTFKSLRSIRGELVWLHAPEVKILRPVRFMHPRYSLYIVPRLNDEYIIGASEIESDDQQPITVRSALEFLSAAYAVQSKFSEARIVKTVTGRRPVLENYLPKIRYSKNYIAVNGLYRHGFLIAPAIANEIAQYLQHGEKARQYSQLWEECA